MITIYSTPTCHFCHLAREWFKSRGINYQEVNLVNNPTAQELITRKTNQMGVPVIDIDGDFIVGFNRVILEKRFETPDK
jgi:glutaredoxin